MCHVRWLGRLRRVLSQGSSTSSREHIDIFVNVKGQSMEFLAIFCLKIYVLVRANSFIFLNN